MPRLLRSTQVLVLFVLLAAAASQLPSPWRDGSLLELSPRWPGHARASKAAAPSAQLAAAPLTLHPVELPAAPEPSEGTGAHEVLPVTRRHDPGRAALAERIAAELVRAERVPVRIVRPCLTHDEAGSCTRRALDRYLEQLVQNALNAADRPARFSQLGDSLVMGDGFTGELRGLLSPWFGDGGHGFVYAGHPERHTGAEGLQLDLSEQWRVRSVVRASEHDPLFGVAGVAFHPDGDPHFGARAPRALPQRLGVLWFPRTDTASLGVVADGTRSLHSEPVTAGASALTWVELPRDTRRVRVDGLNDRSIYFGFLLENPVGSVVDNMGLVSGNVDRMLRIDPAHWRDQIRLRDPDVVSFLYGVNSVEDGVRSRGARHRDEYLAVLTRFRELVPERDCLVIGVLTRGEWIEGDVALHPGVAAIEAAQRGAAATAGCAFWSAFDAAGGEDSAATWYRARPQLLGSDLAHPTRAGYVELARRFHHALLVALGEHLAAHPHPPEPEALHVAE